MIIVRLLSPGPWLVGTTKVYPGVGADIVMESISLADPFSELRAATVLLLVSIQRREYVEVLCSLRFGISVSREKLIAYFTRHTGKNLQAPPCGLFSRSVSFAHAVGSFRIPESDETRRLHSLRIGRSSARRSPNSETTNAHGNGRPRAM